MFIHFKKECLNDFSDNFHAPGEYFRFGNIDPKTNEGGVNLTRHPHFSTFNIL